jgi:hypothetical protein
MAKYNLFVYGTGVKYGPTQVSDYVVPPGGFVGGPTTGGGGGGGTGSEGGIDAVGYGDYTISWVPIGGELSTDPDNFRLVRNFLNLPTDENDGTIVSTSNSGSFTDHDLPEGSFVYYSIFVKTVDEEWLRSGDLILLVTRNWGYSDKLWNYLPEHYRLRDEMQISPFDSNPLRRQDEGPLRRYLRMIGREFDVIRTEYESMRLTPDPRTMGGNTLYLLAKTLGLDYETELGMRRNRSYIENAVHFFKLKGTQPGIEGIVTAVSGWDAEAYLGKNLMLDTRDSTFVLGPPATLIPPFGTWEEVDGGGVFKATDEDTEGFTAPVSGFDEQFLRIEGSGAPGAVGNIQTGMIPVKGLTNITASIYERSSAVGTAGANAVGLAFFDRYLQPISSAVSTFTSSTGWLLQDHTAAVPADAYFARKLYRYEDAAGLNHFIDLAQVEDGITATAYEYPRTIHVKLRADRINLVRNSSMEIAPGTEWVDFTNCTIDRVTTNQRFGAASGRVRSVAAGLMEFGTALMPVEEGRRYAGSLYFEPGPELQSVELAIVWVDASSTIISVVTSPVELEVPADWVRPGITGTAPANAISAYLLGRVLSTDAPNEEHFFDAALFEEADSVKTYFDASLPSSTNDGMWENNGAAHTVPSHLYTKRTIKLFRLKQVLNEYLPAAASSTLEFAKNP